MFDDRGDITQECKLRFDSLDERELFYWYKAYYSKLSEMVSYLRHIGYDLILLHGRLINSVRDLGHNIHCDDMFSAFGVICEDEWHITSYFCHKLWDSIVDFISNDTVLDWYWTRKSEIPPQGQNWQLIYGEGIMIFNVMVRDFPGFPFQRIEVQRYFSATDEQIELFPDLEGRVSPQLNTYSNDDLRTLEERYRYSLHPEWLEKRSRAYLYESPFWTIDEKHIETFLDQKYGDDWKTPRDAFGEQIINEKK